MGRYLPLGGLLPRPPPESLFGLLEGQPAPCGLIGGCPLCLDIGITPFMLLRLC